MPDKRYDYTQRHCVGVLYTENTQIILFVISSQNKDICKLHGKMKFGWRNWFHIWGPFELLGAFPGLSSRRLNRGVWAQVGMPLEWRPTFFHSSGNLIKIYIILQLRPLYFSHWDCKIIPNTSVLVSSIYSTKYNSILSWGLGEHPVGVQWLINLVD